MCIQITKQNLTLQNQTGLYCPYLSKPEVDLRTNYEKSKTYYQEVFDDKKCTKIAEHIQPLKSLMIIEKRNGKKAPTE